MKVVMLGAPGAGKGTQAKLIASRYEIPHISTGDIFRANIKSETTLGLEAKSYMDQGLLVPDELTLKILLDRVEEKDCKNGYVLDGFPRNLAQAKVLDAALSEKGQQIDLCVNVDIADEKIVKRMSGRRACLECGTTYHIAYVPPKKDGICDKCAKPLVLRDDDLPETVLNRLNVYHEQTAPLIAFYQQKNVLKTVDGTKDVKEVFEDITVVMDALSYSKAMKSQEMAAIY
ncbi:MAG: adenylate kinase [Lachnospiraceae bacterium]|jgi:adenylate kinase|nr:adenylate kinase [Lachnospiraceae bacterium]